MLPSKFGVNWPFGSGEETKNRFSRWRPWRPSWISDQNDFSYFWSTSHPDASYQVSSQLAQGCRRSRLLKQLLTPHDGRRTTEDRHWLTTIAHHEHFMLRWANNALGADTGIKSPDTPKGASSLIRTCVWHCKLHGSIAKALSDYRALLVDQNLCSVKMSKRHTFSRGIFPENRNWYFIRTVP